ncbi:MAG TPA: exodeoxyribonuclease VII small subunit, partial [Acidimicrobiales bacterium]
DTWNEDDGYDELSFEQLLSLLEELIERMASADVGIEEATTLYERADHIHALATGRLNQVRERVERLAPGGPTGG